MDSKRIIYKTFFFSLLILKVNLSSGQVQQTWPILQSESFTVNPSLLSEDAVIIMANHHRRWRNVRSSPKVSSFTVQLPFKNQKMSWGIQVSDDKVGPFSSNGIKLAYAYGFPLGRAKTDRLTLGLSGRLLRIDVDHQHFIVNNESDPTIANIDGRSILPPAIAAGFNYSTTPPDYAHPVQFNLGLSINQFLPIEHRFNSFSLERLTQFYGHLGLNISLDPDFHLKPSILIDATERSQTNYAIRLNGSFKKFGWLMIQYSKSGYLTSQLGFHFDASGNAGGKFQLSASNSWYFGNISGELGNGLMLSFAYVKSVL